MTSEIQSTKSKEYPYFLKGDVSGIQEFIFSVKSNRASRTLKGRSFFIHALSEICIARIIHQLGNGNVSVFYNGGGNFYLQLKEEFTHEIAQIQKAINLDCADQEFFVSLSVIKADELDTNFKEAWANLHSKANKDKLRRFDGDIAAFEPKPRNQNTEPFEASGNESAGPFEKFARQLISAKNWSVEKMDDDAKVFIGDSGATIFGCQYRFSGGNGFKDVVHKLPTWSDQIRASYPEAIKSVEERNKGKSDEQDPWKSPENGNIIEFEYFAEFAQLRTGTRKLGVLKLDVDNLGKQFENITDSQTARNLSTALKHFFGDHIKDLLKREFPTMQRPDGKSSAPPPTDKLISFEHNIYPVFSGGDDCFFIGGWDAIFQFALLLHTDFDAYSQKLMKELSLPKKITLSAGLIVVGPKFPVSRFAQLAEKALKEAKKRKAKNAINVFDHTLDWPSFASAQKTAEQLARCILQKGESRAILERLQRESLEFERIANDATAKGIIKGRSVWRLLYSLRRTASNENFSELEGITKEYANTLVDALVSGKATTAPQLQRVPVAARWAEFLTRISNKKS